MARWWRTFRTTPEGRHVRTYAWELGGLLFLHGLLLAVLAAQRTGHFKYGSFLAAVLIVLQLLWTVVAAFRLMLRRIKRNPLFNEEYKALLALSPWDHPQRLPLGRCHYTVGDVLGVLMLASLGTASWWLLVWLTVAQGLSVHMGWLWLQVTVGVSALAMLVLYVLANLANALKVRWCGSLLLVLMPLTIFPHYNLYLSALVLLAMYLLVRHAIEHTLARYAWERPFYEPDPLEQLRQRAQVLPGYPDELLRLMPTPASQRFSLLRKLAFWVAAALWVELFMSTGEILRQAQVGGVLHLFGRTLERPGYQYFALDPVVALLGVAGACVLFNLGNLARFLGQAPIGLRGRVMTGQLIIPWFDIVLLRPLVMLAFGIAMLWLLQSQLLSSHVSLHLTVVGLVLIHHYCPPSPDQWHYTCARSFVPGPYDPHAPALEDL